MRLFSLRMLFEPPAVPTFCSPVRRVLLGLVAACLGATALSAQTSDAEIAELKAQMQQMQEVNAKMAAQMQQMQEDNAKMAAEMKSMQAQVALSASVANSRTLTGPDGKAISLDTGPVVIPPLESFTRNFKWTGYARFGVGFTGNGVGQTSDFKVPDFPTHRRFPSWQRKRHLC
jgi:hypothetical protein